MSLAVLEDSNMAPPSTSAQGLQQCRPPVFVDLIVIDWDEIVREIKEFASVAIAYQDMISLQISSI